MSSLKLFSEPFSRTGNIAADGFRKLLGRPAQDLLQTVLREAIQNSVDASRSGSGPSIYIRYRTLTDAQRTVLQTAVMSDRISCEKTAKNMRESLEKPRLKVLEICDFRTTGLGGPTSGDAVAEEGEALDFVNFLRNVGVARDTPNGGGTYGYGKTSLYAMSACSTILVDTQTTHGAHPVRRFMGCHLGSAFDALAPDGKRKRFTGRHWWGVDDEGGGIDPLSGRPAQALSALLGMPERSLACTGTTMMILDPYIDAESRPPAHEIIETVLWNFWPRLTATTPEHRKLDVRLFIEADEIPLPAPEHFPPLDLFAAAIGDIRSPNARVLSVQRDKPYKKLGSLAIQRGLRSARGAIALDESSNIPAQASHIAVMRPVELVVKYILGEPFPDTRFEWAGVFICADDKDVEEAFAKAEPPAHDDWVPDMLPSGDAKSIVRVALRKLEHHARTYSAPGQATMAQNASKGPSLAKTAAKLGNLLDAASGRGPGIPSPLPRGQKRNRNDLSISMAKFIRLEMNSDRRICAVFEAQLLNDERDPYLSLQAEAGLIADGGLTDISDLPPGFESRVLAMKLDSASDPTHGATLLVGKESGTVTIWVLCPASAAVGVRVQFVRKDK